DLEHGLELRPEGPDDLVARDSVRHGASSVKQCQAEPGPRRSEGQAFSLTPLSELGDVSELLRVRQRAQLLERLVLDLPDALAGDVERPADLVQRPRMLPVQPVAQLEHAPLARGELPEDLLERLLAERDLGCLLWKWHGLVSDEVPELGLLLVADRLLEGHR